jgi:hypothetical protein
MVNIKMLFWQRKACVRCDICLTGDLVQTIVMISRMMW